MWKEAEGTGHSPPCSAIQFVEPCHISRVVNQITYIFRLTVEGIWQVKHYLWELQRWFI